jgi:hypothetical protein
LVNKTLNTTDAIIKGMVETKGRNLRIAIWLLGLVTITAVLIVWAQVRLGGSVLSTYDIFPLLGLIAFSLMWTHFVSGAIRRWLGLPISTLRTYFKFTSWLVLGLILLHPLLFIVQLGLDGLGLPPFSYLGLYPALASQIALLLGTLSLVAFLAFELHRKFRGASWWKYVEYLNILAMLAIFYHGFTLGGELSVGWFQIVWLVYLVTFIGAVSYTQIHKTKGNHEQKSTH